jgi:hypothetical protein
LHAVHAVPTFAGFCYTQFTDTYQEVNGLVYADRAPKAPVEEIAKATMGNHTALDQPEEEDLKERLTATGQRVP